MIHLEEFVRTLKVDEKVQRKMSIFLPRLERCSLIEYTAEDGGLIATAVLMRGGWNGALPG